MRVLAMPADASACGHVRLVWPAETLWRDHGCTIDVIPPGQGIGLRARRDSDGNVLDVDDVDYDVIVVQRCMGRGLTGALTVLQKKYGKRVVVDLDDDLGAVHPGSTAWAAVQPHLNAEQNWKIGTRFLQVADHVTVSTPELAERYCPHGRVTVVPNCVPRAYLSIPGSRPHYLTVGWGGFVGTHAGDLQATGGAVARVVAETGVSFRVVGPGVGVQAGLGLAAEPEATDWVGQADWPKELAQLDVGIAPLEQSRFNQAKSWLKPLEYAALAVPFVASPLPDYLRLNAEGAGLIAAKPKVWRSLLRMLINDPQARRHYAELGRRVAEKHVIEDHAGRWWQAWTGETL